MIGGYESARRWNEHFAQESARAAADIKATLEARADELRRAFPAGASWDGAYEWLQTNCREQYARWYQHSMGGSYTSPTRDLQSIVGVR